MREEKTCRALGITFHLFKNGSCIWIVGGYGFRPTNIGSNRRIVDGTQYLSMSVDLTSNSIRAGPSLPEKLLFPCLVNVDEDKVFLIARVMRSWAPFVNKNNTRAYTYIQSSNKWTPIKMPYFSCIQASKTRGFTCAYLKSEHSVIIAMDSCIVSLNLTSSQWKSHNLPYKSGLLFNIDEEQNTVTFIGTDNVNGSFVHMVRAIIEGQPTINCSIH